MTSWNTAENQKPANIKFLDSETELLEVFTKKREYDFSVQHGASDHF